MAEGYTQFGPLKADTADAVIELLRPIQRRYRELEAEPRCTPQPSWPRAPTRPAEAARCSTVPATALGLLPA